MIFFFSFCPVIFSPLTTCDHCTTSFLLRTSQKGQAHPPYYHPSGPLLDPPQPSLLWTKQTFVPQPLLLWGSQSPQPLWWPDCCHSTALSTGSLSCSAPTRLGELKTLPTQDSDIRCEVPVSASFRSLQWSQMLTWDLGIYCQIRTQIQFGGWTGWRTHVKDFCIKEQKRSKTPIRNWVAFFTGIVSWHMLWNCVIKTRTENYMFHYPELEWEWTGLCTKESVTEKLLKITKNTPRLSSDYISTNILHSVWNEKLFVSYKLSCTNSQTKSSSYFPTVCLDKLIWFGATG